MKDLLTSWKEIATYLGRTTRTVQRWEKEFHLPVHRPPHKQSRLVIADTDELDTWAIERTDKDYSAETIVSPKSRELSREILQDIARKEPLSTVFAALVDFIQDTVSCDFAHISLVDHRLKKLFIAAGSSIPKTFGAVPSLWSTESGFGSCAAAIRTKQPVITACIESDPKWVNLKSLAKKHEIVSCWAQPIVVNGNVIGVVGAYFKKRKRPTYDQLTFLELISYVAGISLQFSGVNEPIDQFEKTAAFIGCDRNCVIRAMNREAARLMDKSLREVVGQNLWDLYPNAAPIVVREYHRALNENITVAFEVVSNTLGARFTVIARPSNDGLLILFREVATKAASAVA